jgi:hypothetical protein
MINNDQLLTMTEVLNFNLPPGAIINIMTEGFNFNLPHDALVASSAKKQKFWYQPEQ